MAFKEELKKQGDFLFRWRSYFPIVLIVFGVYYYVQNEIAFAERHISIEKWPEFLGLVLSLLGLAIRVIAVGYSADNTSGRNTHQGQIADSINTKGIYSLCRHPLYLGNFLMWLGIACFTQNAWFVFSFVLVFWLYYERIMYAEEAFLRDKFGTAYRQWADATPAFIPKLSLWKANTKNFNWAKVIRQEKTGLLNLFLVIFILKLAGNYFTNQSWIGEDSYWLYALLASIILYALIKLKQVISKK